MQLRESGLIGTQLGAIVPATVLFLPFAIWLLTTFFRELPAEVEDAASVDGAGRLRVLTSVVVPLAAPSLFATGVFVFVLAWNVLIFASTFTLSEFVRPVTVVLSDLVAAARLGFSPGPGRPRSSRATDSPPWLSPTPSTTVKVPSCSTRP